MSFAQGAPTQPLVLRGSNVFLYGSSTAGNAFSVQQLSTGNVASFVTSTGATGLIVNPTGLVGIGKTNPAYALDVTGDLNFTGTFRQNGTAYIGSQWTGTTSLYFLGNVGIGTATPTAALDIVDQTNGLIQLSEYNSTDGVAIRARRALGTLAAPTGVVADSVIVALRGFGYTSASAFSGRTVGIELCAAETFSATATGSYIRFDTCALTTTTNSEKMRILGNGNVGIGTTNPTALLTCSAAYTNGGTHAEETNAKILLGVTGQGYGVGIQLRVPANSTVNESDLQFTTTDNSSNQIVRMTIKGSSNPTGGNVGIGTATNINSPLVVYNSASTSTYTGTTAWGNLHLMPQGTDNSWAGITFGGSGGGTIQQSTQASITVDSNNANGTKMRFNVGYLFASGAIERMTILGQTGNVGIGTTSPTCLLEVVGGQICQRTSDQYTTCDSGRLILQAAAYSAVNMQISAKNNYYGLIDVVSSSAVIATVGSPFPLALQTSGGNVGIGNTTPPVKLWVPSTSTTTGIGVYNGDVALIIGNLAGGTTTGSIQVKSGGSSSTIGATNYALALNPNGGNVGIGTHPGSYTLQVAGTVGASSSINSALNTNANGGYFIAQNLNAGASAFSSMQFQTDTGSAWIFKNSSNRTADGGVKTCTFRNDDGDLKLAGASDSPFIYLKSSNGNVGIGVTNPGGKLDVRGAVQITNTSAGYAVPNGYMQAGSLSIGDTLLNYGGGSNWNSNTTGFMMECLNNTEFAIHDAGERVSSFMYYSGNRFTVGRDMGFGAITSTNFLGSVGIGTAAPATALDVSGTITASGSLNMTGNATRIKFNSTAAWSGDAGTGFGKLEYHVNRWYINAGSDSAMVCQFRRGGTDLSYVDNSGTYIGNISGSASSAGTATNQSGGTVAATTGSFSSTLSLSGIISFSGTSTSLPGINLPTSGSGIHWGNGYSRILDDGDLRVCSDDNMHFYSGCNASSLGTERITLLNSGNVGIGQVSPSAKLHVSNGDTSMARFGPNGTWGASLLVGSGGSNATASGVGQMMVSNGNLHIDAGLGQHIYLNYYTSYAGSRTFVFGRMGLGTDAPEAPLHVVTQNISFYFPSSYYYISLSGTGTIGGPFTATVQICAYFSGGRIVVGGEVDALSDRRKKTNIKHLETALDDIRKVRITTYQMIDDGSRECGVIAQELDEIYPFMVKKNGVEFLPTSNCFAEIIQVTDELVGITFENFAELTVDDKLRIVLDNNTKQELKVERVSNSGVYFKKWEKFDESQKIYVYGKEHRDVQTVTKNALFMTNIRATQELADKVDRLEAENKILHARLDALEKLLVKE